jgi:hypothetical protein
MSRRSGIRFADKDMRQDDSKMRHPVPAGVAEMQAVCR